MDIPNLLDVQLQSFENFLQLKVAPDKRANQGLQAVFEEVFPISDARGNFSLEFVSYGLGEPKYDVDECAERDVTFAAPLKATLRLLVKETVDGEKKVKEVIEQEVYLGELPIITEKGTFIINGAERVIVSQLHRSPGVFFDEETHPNGKRLFTARIIPYRGSWVEFTTDINDMIYVHIDRKRKLPVTVLLYAHARNRPRRKARIRRRRGRRRRVRIRDREEASGSGRIGLCRNLAARPGRVHEAAPKRTDEGVAASRGRG